ncbi:ABC transporter substrate-binding protein [Agromyces sp. NPDC049794]|uniref:ABC transporter substrate-binding protein n=1 Tax=unclassified Agromyces TaxID=2639701 RepID=UPI0033F9AE86
MKNTGKRGGALALILASALAVTACTGDTGGGATEKADDGVERIYVQAVGGDPVTFGMNAQFSSAPISQLMSAQMMDTLVMLSDDYQLTPGLAERWELSDDGLELTLELREGVTWHDGEPFTAEDVKFNFDEIVPLQVYGGPLAERIESTEITDDTTVVVSLSAPYGPLLEAVAMQFMIPKHIYEGTDYLSNPANNEPVGTGPFMFESYSSGEQVTMVRNPDYWGGDIEVDRLVYTTLPDANTRAVSLFAGEIDQAAINPAEQERVTDDPNTELLDGGLFGQVVVAMFNTQSPYLQDAKVRAAIFSALDRQEIADTALSGLAEPANGFFPDSIDWAVNPDVDFDKRFPRDIKSIEKTLDEAGFPRGADGTRFTLRLNYITPLTEVGATVELAQSMLSEVGIATEVLGTSGAIFNEQTYTNSDFDMAFLRTSLGPDPSVGITRWYVCNPNKLAASNPSGICDAEIDEAADAALATTDQKVRGEALKDLQERAEELMFYGTLAWYYGANGTVNTTRWDGQNERPPMTSRMPWLEMTPVD